MQPEKIQPEKLEKEISISIVSQLNQLLTSENAKCLSGNKSQTLCLNSKCSIKSPFICTETQCPTCANAHQQCIQKRVVLFVNTLKQRQKLIEKIKESIYVEADKLIDQISNARDNCIKLLNSLDSMKEQQKLGKETITSEWLSQLWNKNRDTLISVDLKKINAQMNKLTQYFKLEVQKYFSAVSQHLKKGLMYESNKLIKPQQKIYWDQNLKYSQVKVEGLKVRKNNDSTFGYALLSPGLNKISANNIEWKVRINNFGSWIGIGICLRQFTRNNSFQILNTNEAQHGGYMISANKYAWAHQEKAVNRNQSSFGFAKNDIIIVSVNLNAAVITFKKEGTSDKFDLKFNKIQANLQDQYHICVCLVNRNDQIELLSLLSPLKIDEHEIVL